jgi:hypothetical protein
MVVESNFHSTPYALDREWLFVYFVLFCKISILGKLIAGQMAV